MRLIRKLARSVYDYVSGADFERAQESLYRLEDHPLLSNSSIPNMKEALRTSSEALNRAKVNAVYLPNLVDTIIVASSITAAFRTRNLDDLLMYMVGIAATETARYSARQPLRRILTVNAHTEKMLDRTQTIQEIVREIYTKLDKSSR